MAKKVTKKSTKARTRSSAQAASAQPTLHGLLIARDFSGTVVRGLLFAILVFGFVLIGAGSTDDFDGGNALLTWLVMTLIYVVFDIKYVIMSRIRPLHPRLDRVVLPLALVFSLLAVFAPLFFVNDAGSHLVGLWVTAAIVLVCILGVRFALLLASKK